MSAPDWTAIATRFQAAAAKLTVCVCGKPRDENHRPVAAYGAWCCPDRIGTPAPKNWWRRVGAFANRLTPRVCPQCGGDGLHRLPCERAHRSIDPRIQFGNAVIRAERRLAALRALHALLHDLGQVTVVGMGRCERCPS